MPSTRRFLIVTVLAALPLFAAAAQPQTRPAARGAARPAATQPALAITYGPYLQAPSDSGMTVCWMTSRKCVSAVEYAEGASGQYATAISSHFGLIDANVTFHAVRLSGLKAGTSYTYRVVSKEIVDQQAYKVVYGATIRSEPRRFTTFDPRKRQFSFVVLNDRHEHLPEAALGKVDWTDVDFALYNGDMVNDCRTEQQMMRCVVEPSTFAKTIPFIFVRGNHDTRGPAARVLLNYFPTDSGRYYYGFDHGGVHFTVLDTGEDKHDVNAEYFGLVDFEPYMAQETQWLKDEVHSAAYGNARFRMAIMHVPPVVDNDPKFYKGEYLLRNWCPLLAQADIMLSGHTHRFDELAADPPSRPFPLLIGGTNTVFRVNVKGEQLEVLATRDNGTELRPPVKVAAKR